MRKLSLMALLALAACVEVPEPGAAPADACGAAGLQGLVGQPRTVLETMRFGTEVRITGEGDPVTLDFSPTRLNIAYGRDGRISRVFCG